MTTSSRFNAMCLLLAFLCFLARTQSSSHNRTQALYDQVHSDNIALATGFDWSALQASNYLNYTACYEGFECARLEVPLDWDNASNHNKVQLALIRLPATVPESDPSFGGSILFNPGGPGGSGIDTMRWTGHGIRDIVDGDVHFEIISWDPRAVHHTTPSISCFKEDWQRDVFLYRNNVLGPMDATNASLVQRWGLARSFGRLCEQSNHGSYADGSHIAQFATTALVVRDMVEIIDQIQIHRAKRFWPATNPDLQRSLQETGAALLNYWGLSYGSYLGNTFASMFPARVGRMVLDSVVDTEDYNALGWFSNLQDYNRTLDLFYSDCFGAGSRCPLNSLEFSSSGEMATRIDRLLDDLKKDPIAVLHDDTADIVTSADVSSLLFTTMRSPTWSWQELAHILLDLIRRDGASMAQYLQSLKKLGGTKIEDEVGWNLLQRKNETKPYPPDYTGEAEAGHVTLCSDGDDITHLTAADWFGRLKTWQSQSPIAGWKWSEIPMLCAHWPKAWRPAPRNRFTGPWASRLVDYSPGASPLLFVGSTADPVLPLRNAYKAAASHEGARVLIQDAPGHCTGYVNPVACTWDHIRRFFATGELPKNNTVCERESTPWLKIRT